MSTTLSVPGKTTLHLIWGRDAVNRYKLGIIDNLVRLAHAAYEFESPKESLIFLFGVKEARDIDEWLVVTNLLDIHKLGMPLRTRLIDAARRGDVDAVKQLINTGIKLDAVDEMGLNALHHASKSGQNQVVHVLIEAGADVDAPAGNGSGKTPLHLASESRTVGTSGVVQILVDSNANANARDARGSTPLHGLISGEDAKLGSADVKARALLRDGGADPRTRNEAGDLPGDNPSLGMLKSGALIAAIGAMMREQQQHLADASARSSALKRLNSNIRPPGMPTPPGWN